MIKMAKKQAKNIGIQVTPPKDTCEDTNCPFHGNISLRGRVFSGKVTAAKMHKTVTVEWERRYFIPKYERYEKRKTRIKAHNPGCINAGADDIVVIGETRPISKTKHFVVLEIKKKAEKK